MIRVNRTMLQQPRWWCRRRPHRQMQPTMTITAAAITQQHRVLRLRSTSNSTGAMWRARSHRSVVVGAHQTGRVQATRCLTMAPARRMKRNAASIGKEELYLKYSETWL